MRSATCNSTGSFQLDKEVLDQIAAGNPEAENKSLLKYWCEYDYITENMRRNGYIYAADIRQMALGVFQHALSSTTPSPTIKVGTVECKFIRNYYSVNSVNNCG